jgi:hypothetical protein
VPRPRLPDNAVRAEFFDEQAFLRLVHEESCASENADSQPQAEYLARYLTSLGATCLVVEHHYMDRHYMDEFSAYYSRCFLPPKSVCVRFHAFKNLEEGEFETYLNRAASGDLALVRKELNERYLGFIVVRPIPSAPIGRTVLRHFEETAERKFPVTVKYTVHLLGIELAVVGLAFQQQDGGVAACATTAVWSALQRACRTDGYRTPTTREIAEAAVKHVLPEGRPFPSTGLTTEQINDALRSFAFPAETLKVSKNAQYFLLMMNSYLRSGMPVILGLYGEDDDGGEFGHAVTVVGYRIGNKPQKAEKFGDNRITLRNLDCSRLYVHDDQVGPYATATLSKANWRDKRRSRDRLASGHQEFEKHLKLTIEVAGHKPRKTWVRLGIVPLYSKIRASVDELLQLSVNLIPAFESVADQFNAPAGLELLFRRAGDYQADLYSEGLPASELVRFQRAVALSRYVGLSRWYVGDEKVADLIWDTTDIIYRETGVEQSLLGVVVYQGSVGSVIRKLVVETMHAADVPIICAEEDDCSSASAERGKLSKNSVA